MKSGPMVRLRPSTPQSRPIRVEADTIVSLVVPAGYQQVDVIPDLSCYLTAGSRFGRSHLTVRFYFYRSGTGHILLRSGMGGGETCHCAIPYPLVVSPRSSPDRVGASS